jgi:hypothetical protein
LPSRTSQTSNVVRPLVVLLFPLPVVGVPPPVAGGRTPGVVVTSCDGVGLAVVALGRGDAVGARPSDPDRAGPHPVTSTQAAAQTATDRAARRRRPAGGGEGQFQAPGVV